MRPAHLKIPVFDLAVLTVLIILTVLVVLTGHASKQTVYRFKCIIVLSQAFAWAACNAAILAY